MHKFLFIATVLMISSWSFNAGLRTQGAIVSNTMQAVQKHSKKDSVKKALSENLNFFVKRLLRGHGAVIQNYMRKYQRSTCGILAYKDSDLKADFEGVKAIKSIFINEKADTVFVMPPFNRCDDGESYVFYNKALPRLYTNSDCCHPASLLVLPDIDEDGIRELGIYYSSCSSRFKALVIYSLKGGRWKKIASSVFDTFMKEPEKTRFSTSVKKISKGKFKICDLMDGKTEWKTVSMR